MKSQEKVNALKGWKLKWMNHQKIDLSLQKGRCSNASSSFINKFNLIQYNESLQ